MIVNRTTLSVGSGLDSRAVIRGSRTVIQAKLTDFTIEDLTENTLYSKVCFLLLLCV